MSETETSSNMPTDAMVSVKFNGNVWQPGESGQRVPVRDLFDVLVYTSDEMALVPRNELAKSLLAQWLSGECQRSATLKSYLNPTDHAYGRDLAHLTFRFSSRPMLCSGNDPYFTGMTLTPDEAKAARAFIDAERAKHYEAERKTKKRGLTKRGTK